ncbi:hypothetical protein Tco_0886996 [Tanacetum coccineum]
MVDSQLVEEEVRGLEPGYVGTKTQKRPTGPVSKNQKTLSPSSTFVKENIDALRIMIKEHDHQTKAKTTPRKFVYADSKREAPKWKKRFFQFDSPSSPLTRLTHMAKPIPLAKVRRVSPKTKNFHTPEGQEGWRTGAKLRK